MSSAKEAIKERALLSDMELRVTDRDILILTISDRKISRLVCRVIEPVQYTETANVSKNA